VKLENPRPALFFADQKTEGRIRPVLDQSGRVQVHVELMTAARLVFAEVGYPGWEARIDGRRTIMTPFEETFMAVDLPPGPHEVEWEYKPWSFRIGLAISILGPMGLFSLSLL
jgi:uncharacterized membrane protein YfhO